MAVRLMADALGREMEFIKYSKGHIHYYSEKVPFLVKGIFEKDRISNIADLGSGDGSILYALFKNGYLDNAEKITAIDISKERINRVKRISNKIMCIIADVCDLHMLSNEVFDLIISNQVIEHVEDEAALIKEAHRILMDNGLFYLSTVYKKWYGWYFYRCRSRWVLDPTHLREYQSEDQLLDLFKEHNFTLLEKSMKLQWFPITDFIFKRIGRGIHIYNNKVARLLRNIKIPILGYYNWELVFKKE